MDGRQNGIRKKQHFSLELSGVMTVELAYLIPVILLVLELVIYAVFYYHDKNILIGAAGETAVAAAQYERKPGGQEAVNWEEFLQMQIEGKLILFSGIETEVTRTEEKIEVAVSAQKGLMRLEVLQRAVVSLPEKRIRRMQILQELIPEEEREEGESPDEERLGEENPEGETEKDEREVME